MESVGRDMPATDAILRAEHNRLRPILMASLAFGFALLPLAQQGNRVTLH